MKSLSYLSLLLMASMFLLLGGCQRDEALLDSFGNSVGANGKMDSLSLKKFTLPDESNFITKGRSGGTAVSYDSLSKICDLILQQNSTNHFLLQFIQSNGYPAWEKAFEFGEKRGSAKIIGIPFVKDGKVKGVLQYYSIFGDLGLTYFSSEAADYTIKLTDEVITDIDKTSILYHIIAQTKCSGISDSLLVDWYLGHLSMFTDASGLRVRNCEIYCGPAEFTYINDGTTITAIGNGCVEVCYEVPGFISHSQGNFIISTGSNWWQNNWNGSSGQGNGGDTDKDEIQKEEEERKKKELAECVASQSDAETEAMLDEALKDVKFPCKNHKETVMIKNMTKDLVKEAWCIEQSDNPGPLQPDGTHLKPKMTATDIQNAVNKALDGVEKIIPDVTFNSCDHLKCIYNAIAKQNNTLWCNTTANFDNIGNSDVILQVGGGKNNVDANYFTTINPKSKGVTTINNDGQIVIAFNPSLCNSDQPLLIALTILHEGIHAEIWRYMKENWTFGDWPDNVNNTTSEEAFKKLFEIACDKTNSKNQQHREMLYNWIDDLAKGLYEFNGKQGKWQDYKYLAYQGLWNENDKCATGVLSLDEYNMLEKNFKGITNNFNFEECE